MDQTFENGKSPPKAGAPALLQGGIVSTGTAPRSIQVHAGGVSGRYFQGDHSPNEEERKHKGYSSSWLHHKGRNKHHLEYWIDYSPEAGHQMCGMEMPVRYVVEMFCDRMAASKTYRKELYDDRDPYDYYMSSKDHYLLHPNTRELLERLLTMLKEKGEEETFAYIRNEVLQPKGKRK